jgi:hypothetical protein
MKLKPHLPNEKVHVVDEASAHYLDNCRVVGTHNEYQGVRYYKVEVYSPNHPAVFINSVSEKCLEEGWLEDCM